MARLKDRLNAAAEGEASSQALLKEGGERFANVPVSAILPDPDQPRKSLGNLEELKASIQEHGIIQPIVISPFGEEQFLIIAGERRFSAAKELGLKTVPAIIRTVDEHRRLEVQIIENIHRQDLNPLEEAAAYRKLMEEFSLSQRQLAARLGKSPAAINETIRILSLPDEILESVRTSERLTRSVLLEIAKQENEEARDALWQSAMNGSLTVKTARQKKDRSVAPDAKPRVSVPFRTKQATVTLVFAQDSVTPQEVVDALAQALREAKAAMRETGNSLANQASEEPKAEL